MRARKRLQRCRAVFRLSRPVADLL